ncbi:MAG: DUF1592 domain-containing protein [Bryobacterales bacterium]|nr:DUF1592 domain-containing protein [Bryobacterales bacterium]
MPPPSATASALALFAVAVCQPALAGDAGFAAAYCLNCHGASQPQGGFVADMAVLDPGDSGTQERWTLAAGLVSAGLMPPHGAPQPSASERESFARAVRERLDQVGVEGDGGGLSRRLNRIEYLNTLRDLFGIREIRLPVTFPDDSPAERFDTMAGGLDLTPGHLDAYHEVAVDIADRMVPLPGRPVVRSSADRTNVGQDPARTKFWTRDDDDTGLYFTGVNIAGWSGALWDRGFIAPSSGLFRVRMKVSAEAAMGADGQPLRLGFYALNPSDYDLPKRALRARLPRVGELVVTNTEPVEMDAELHLEKGETFHVYCENRFVGRYPDTLKREPGFTEDLRRLLAKYLEAAYGAPEPTVRFEHMEVSGPHGPLPRQRDFLKGREHASLRLYAETALLPLAERAFRRPLSGSEHETLIADVLEHMESARVPEHGIHYGIRRILLSPQFLFRAPPGGMSDSYALAGRLSYFLWSTMPDAELLELAANRMLSAPDVVRAQIERMVRDPRSSEFVRHFTGQWLANRKASAVMVCDVRHVWSELIRYGMVRSAEMFFGEILRSNLSIRNFIDSDFTYANEPMRIAWGIPGSEVDLRRLEADQRQSLVWPKPERLDLASLGPGTPANLALRGGVLGLSGVFAATADGVESSPILRGVWVLENVLGRPPPPPPSDVPALVADTTGARTVRETLAAHQSVGSCAVCHSQIDPIGLALENYDAAGGWRDTYYSEDGVGLPVDVRAELADGTKLDGPQGLKDYLLARPQEFTRTLAGLLLEYATGQTPAAADRAVIREIVQAEPDGGYGLRDLIAEIVVSEGFTASR